MTPPVDAQGAQAALTLGGWLQGHAGHVLLGLGALTLALRLRAGLRRAPLRATAARLATEARAYEARQGRVSAAEMARRLPCPAAGGIPLGYAPPLPWRPWRRRPAYRPVGIAWDADLGHILSVAPSRSGKSFDATDKLLRFPGPAVAVDPKGELWKRTAGTRAARYGPVYRIPEGGVDLCRLFDWGRALDRREVFDCLLRPWQDREPFFAERMYPLFQLAHELRAVTGEHPLRFLARAAQAAPGSVVAAVLPHVPAAAVEALTGGLEPAQLNSDRTFGACWSTFTSRYGPLGELVDHLAAGVEAGGVPDDWASQNGTVYVTFPMHAQRAVGPLVAVLVAGLLRRLQTHPAGRRALLLLDEAPAVGLPHLATYLSTVGGAGSGCTAVVYTQSLAALEATYDAKEVRSIVSNCAFQAFSRPQDVDTARYLSDVWGDTLEVAEGASAGTTQGQSTSGVVLPGSGQSWSSGANAGASLGTRYRAALPPTEATAMPRGEVAVFADGLRARLYGAMVVWRPWVDRLPPPPPASSSTEIPPVEPNRQAPPRQEPPAAQGPPAPDTVW